MKKSFMDFIDVSDQYNRKTKTWTVCSKGGDQLGEIHWFASWRRYCFMPLAYTVFDGVCLREIAAFIGRQMLERGITK